MIFVFFILLFLFIIFCFLMSLRKPPEEEIELFSTDNPHYKIGAEVSYYFYDEVKQYCSNHRMTISDLIRISVRSYMDTNP